MQSAKPIATNSGRDAIRKMTLVLRRPFLLSYEHHVNAPLRSFIVIKVSNVRPKYPASSFRCQTKFTLFPAVRTNTIFFDNLFLHYLFPSSIFQFPKSANMDEKDVRRGKFGTVTGIGIAERIWPHKILARKTIRHKLAEFEQNAE